MNPIYNYKKKIQYSITKFFPNKKKLITNNKRKIQSSITKFFPNKNDLITVKIDSNQSNGEAEGSKSAESSPCLRLSRRRSSKSEINPARKYRTIKGPAKKLNVIGSDVGVKAAANKVIENTQMRQGLRIVDPLKKPIKLKVSRNTGSSKARPKSKIILNTKSR